MHPEITHRNRPASSPPLLTFSTDDTEDTRELSYWVPAISLMFCSEACLSSPPEPPCLFYSQRSSFHPCLFPYLSPYHFPFPSAVIPFGVFPTPSFFGLHSRDSRGYPRKLSCRNSLYSRLCSQ